MDELWLGYDNLCVPCADVVALLVYRSALDRRILHAFGYIPTNIRTVVVLADGRYLPSSWRPEQLRSRMTGWRTSAAG
jgi:hypothetical protein